MDAAAFTKALKTNPPQSVYLFHGEEEYAAEQCLRHLLETLQPEGGDTDRDVFTAGGDVAAWSAALSAPAWLSPVRVVVVRDEALWKWNADHAHHKALKAMLAAPPSGSVLAVLKRGKADARTAMYKLFKPFEVYCPAYNPQQAAVWVQKNAVRAGAACQPEAAQLLVQRAGCELWTLRQELDKLLAYTQNGTIDTQAVAAISVANPQFRIFELTDALAEGRTARAQQLLYDALADGQAPMMLLSMLGRQLTQLLAVATHRAGQSELASALNVPPFVLQKMRRQASRFAVPRLRELVARSARTEEALKSGQLRNDTLALEALVLELCEGT